MTIEFCCNQCFHPMTKEQAECAYCGSTERTIKCFGCGGPMLKIPVPGDTQGMQYICQPCAFKNGLHLKKSKDV